MSATEEILLANTGTSQDELEYQLEKRGLEFDAAEVKRLIEQGLIEQRGDTFWAVIPERPDPRKRRWSDSELLDRVHLWKLIVGKPPTMRAWDPDRLEQTVLNALANLRERVQQHREIQELYRAGDWPSERTIRDRFGSLNAALVLCGYEPRDPGRHAPARKLREPKYGPDAMRQLVEAVDSAREREARGELRTALYELAVAAMTEADRL